MLISNIVLLGKVEINWLIIYSKVLVYNIFYDLATPYFSEIEVRKRAPDFFFFK